MEIHLLDAMTLKRLKSFTPPHRSAALLTFTPESRSLMWFGDQPGAIISWDLQTGVRVGEIVTEESLLRPLSITHSGCGAMIGVLFKDENDSPTINTYNILSGALIYRHPIEGTSSDTIWRHGDCVRFTTVEPWSITIWEVGFSSEIPPTEVESFPTPNDFQTSSGFLFHPTPPRLASIQPEDSVLVWDVQCSKLLLDLVVVKNLTHEMSFSTDGHFFAHKDGDGIWLWKESPTGYIFHSKLVLNGTGMEVPAQFFSPDGQSIVTAGGRDLQLWRTTDSSSSTSSVLAGDFRGTDQTKPFVIGFSLDELLAVAARSRHKTAIVLDLKSGATRLTLNTGTSIYALGVAGNALAVVGGNKVITWNLPTAIHALSARADRNDSVRTTRLDRGELFRPLRDKSGSGAISPDLNYVVVLREYSLGRDYCDIYDASTGRCLKQIESLGYSLWFTPDGREFWCSVSTVVLPTYIGWAIAKSSESDVTELKPLGPTVSPSGGYPWQSPHGCQVTDDGWVFNSTGKRILWLPPHWRSAERHRKWSGRFLALLHPGLPEVVVLELLAE